MIKKTKQVSRLVMALLILGIPFKVNAYSFVVGYADTGGGSTSTPDPDQSISLGGETIEITKNYKKEEYQYKCVYNYTISVSNRITINGYNLEDEEIMANSLKIDEQNKIPAGTSIGLNIYETKTISWRIDKIEVQKRKRDLLKYYRYKCRYTNNSSTGQVISTTSDKYVAIPLSNYELENNVQQIAENCSKYNTEWSTYCPARNGCSYTKTYAGQDRNWTEKSWEGWQEDNNASRNEECTRYAINEAIGEANKYFSSSYELELSNSNDIDSNDTIKITNEDANKTQTCTKNGQMATGAACKFSSVTDATNAPRQESRQITFNYKKNNVCINPIDAKITYRSSGCLDDELHVKNTTKNGLEHWHYFVPLNAKSNEKLEINLMPAYGGNLNKGQCEYVMGATAGKGNPVYYDRLNNINENKTSYIDLIIPKEEGKNFAGNYCTIKTGNLSCNKNSSDYTQIEKDNGCRLTSKIKIPIKQEFYNEVKNTSTNKITFDGFNFYYKPINVDGATKDNQRSIVFQNGLKTPSLWEDWYKAQTDRRAKDAEKSPDLTKSFSNNPTYIASNIKAAQVRRYNKNNNYTSWDKMNIDGKSQFINTQGMIFRGEPGEVYKLGCGPANSDKNSILYIKGCDVKS